MKIGVTQIVLGRMSLDDTLELCQEAGYDALELVFRSRQRPGGRHERGRTRAGGKAV